jgi:hypothetical protein
MISHVPVKVFGHEINCSESSRHRVKEQTSETYVIVRSVGRAVFLSPQNSAKRPSDRGARRSGDPPSRDLNVLNRLS